MTHTSELNTLTLELAIKGLKAGTFSATELVTACFAQIEEKNAILNVFLTLTKDSALAAAKNADKKIATNADAAFAAQPLLGIPYACKDNFCTKGVTTTAASNILKDYVPQYESTVTKKLAAAGAILLGKTNLDAFAHGSSTETSDFGPTKNPWNTDHLPGGSSGGSAAAVAADMCIFAIGSETAGSIRCPASWCGVTGFKPTYGRVSRYGVIAMASSTDSPGPMCKTVTDCALVLNVLAGKDPLDATSSPAPSADYTGNLSPKDLSGLTIGKPQSYFALDLEAGVAKEVETAVDQFANLGAKIVDIDLLDPKYSISIYTILQRAEVSSNLARFTGVRYGNTRDQFGFEAKKRMLLGAYVLSAGYYDAYYAKAQKARTLLVQDFARAFEQVDLIIGPTMPSVAPKVGEAESSSSMYGELIDLLQEPSSIAGLTAISLPCGFHANLPVGVQLIGPQFSEAQVLQAASVYQTATNFHERKPN